MVTESNIISLLKELKDNFQSIGTIFPSSSHLAKTLSQILVGDEPRRIIEVGAGTGPITAVLLEQLRPEDTLTICEINQALCEKLVKNLEKSDSYQSKKNQLTIVNSPIQEVKESAFYTHLICSLPFLNFPEELSEEIFKNLSRISTPDAKMSYFSYLGGRTLGALFSEERKKSVKFLDEQKFFQTVRNEYVWLNIFPANVQMLKK